MNKIVEVGLLATLVFSDAVCGQNAPPAKSVAERLGYPANSRLLVIHADDFGMSHSVNRAIEEALEKHWVTSASILVPCPWFPEVARWANAHPDADLGVHLALKSQRTTFRWAPVSAQPKGSRLLAPDGYVPPGATHDHPDWGAEWRQNDFDLVRSPEFQKFLRDQGFTLVAWRDLAKALPQ